MKRSKSSTASSSRHKAEAERAALLVQAEGLKKKLAFDKEEAEMMRRSAEIKAKREILTLETQLATADAKIKVYDEMDERSSVYSKKKEKLKAASSQDDDDEEEEDGVDDENNEDDDDAVW